MNSLHRKDHLASHLNKMRAVLPTQYAFYPHTWVLPRDFHRLQEYAWSRKIPAYFIVKPDRACMGRGIFLTRDIGTLGRWSRCVCQRYLTKPYLIDGYKFDLRIYVLVTSCCPLRIYVYKEGLVRLATEKYEPPSLDNMSISTVFSKYNFMCGMVFLCINFHISFNFRIMSKKQKRTLKDENRLFNEEWEQTFNKFFQQNNNATEATYKVAYILGKRGKPFSDVEMIK
ncbi:TTLL6 [Cordylochernes scorpioides]|uniref:TTLL6 n=1 Tax=Cordylochernes scorpioides TaxID=51811 RepID=A0ABY6KFD5_9ARAC|nr:TTLL6 [Cordylochernes scorpioides]